MSIWLQPDDIKVGQPVGFNIFDAAGHLLLRRGNVVVDQHQCSDLLSRGRRISEDAVRPSALTFGSRSLLARGKSVSVFKLLKEAETSLATLFANPPEQGFIEAIEPVAILIRRAYRLDRDAAMALVMLQHGPGYPIYHHVHAAIVSISILDQLTIVPGESTQMSIVCAALTMNIGMLALQQTLWHSAVPPTPTQRQQIAAHPLKSVELLQGYGISDPMWLAVVAEHHEAIDGSGYPMQLKDEQISHAAQVVAIADRYCAMVSGRAHREPMLAKRVLGELFLSRVNLNNKIAASLIKAMGVYPPGSLVKLSNQDIAVVTKLTANAHQPIVRSVLSGAGHRLIPAPERITSNEKFTIIEALPASKISFSIEPGELWDKVFVND